MPDSVAEKKALSPLAKGLMLLFGVPIVLTIGFVSYFEATGESRITYVCKKIAPGMGLTQLKEFALEHKLSVPGRGSGTVFLGDARSYGRHTCKVILDGDVVKSAEYSFAD